MADAPIMDIFEPGDSTCLICCDLQDYQEFMAQQMHSLDYKVHIGSNFEDIIAKLTATVYDVILLFETIEDCDLENNEALGHIVNMELEKRHEQFVCLVGPGVRTNDEMIAFVLSVDMTMSIHDVANMKTLLRRAVARYRDFYGLYKETLGSEGLHSSRH